MKTTNSNLKCRVFNNIKSLGIMTFSLCLIVLVMALVFTNHCLADNSSSDSYFIGKFNHLAPESQNSSNILYAQASEEVLIETETIEAAPNYKTGYYGTKDWQAFIGIYLWVVGMNGDIGVGDTTADIDLSFGDLWENFDVGGQLNIEFWWKKLIFFVDPMYMKLSSTNSQTRVIGTRKADTEVKMFLMDLAVGYRVAELALGQNTKSNNFKMWPALAVDVYGGGRIISVDSTIDFTLETPIGPRKQRASLDETWFDFIVGTRFLFDFTESLLLSIKTDIGGFGLGFSSDIDWNFVANLGYTLPWYGVTPYIGYRVLYIDYEDGSGNNRFKYDIWHTGPQIGLGVRV